MLNVLGQHMCSASVWDQVDERTLCCQFEPVSDSEDCKTNLQTMSKKTTWKSRVIESITRLTMRF